MNTLLKAFLLITLSALIITVLALIIISSFAYTSTKAKATDKARNMKVIVKLFTYKPKALEVPVGTTVVWTNGDAIEHSVTNGTPDKPGNAFDSGFFTKGQSYSFTFDQPGEYTYFCKRHNSMTGVIKVIP
jgi:plastocyanin